MSRSVRVFIDTRYLDFERFGLPRKVEQNAFLSQVRDGLEEKFYGIDVSFSYTRDYLEHGDRVLLLHNSKEIDHLEKFGGSLDDIGFSPRDSFETEVNVGDIVEKMSELGTVDLNTIADATATSGAHEIGHSLLPCGSHSTEPDNLMSQGEVFSEMFRSDGGSQLEFTSFQKILMNNSIESGAAFDVVKMQSLRTDNTLAALERYDLAYNFVEGNHDGLSGDDCSRDIGVEAEPPSFGGENVSVESVPASDWLPQYGPRSDPPNYLNAEMSSNTDVSFEGGDADTNIDMGVETDASVTDIGDGGGILDQLAEEAGELLENPIEALFKALFES